MTAVIKKISGWLLIVCLLLLPLLSICQPPPPNEGGENPEVPFDTNMNLIFLAVAVFFAAYVAYKKAGAKKSIV